MNCKEKIRLSYLSLDFGTTSLKAGLFTVSKKQKNNLDDLKFELESFPYQNGPTNLVLPIAKNEIDFFAPTLTNFLAALQSALLFFTNRGYNLHSLNGITVFGCAPTLLVLDKNRKPISDLFLASKFKAANRGGFGYYDLQLLGLLKELGYNVDLEDSKLVYKKFKGCLFIPFTDYVGYLLTGVARFSVASGKLKPYFYSNTFRGLFPSNCKLGDKVGTTKNGLTSFFKNTNIPLYSGGADYISDMIGTNFCDSQVGLLRCGSKEGFNLLVKNRAKALRAKIFGFSVMPHPFIKGYVVSKIVEPFSSINMEKYLAVLDNNFLKYIKEENGVRKIVLCGGSANNIEANKIREKLLGESLIVSTWGRYCGVAGGVGLMLYRQGYFKTLGGTSKFLSTFAQKK